MLKKRPKRKSKKQTFKDYLIEQSFETLGLRRMLLDAQAFQEDEGAKTKIVIALEDVTDREK